MGRQEEIVKERMKKIEELKKEGVNPYPSKVERSSSLGEVLKSFSAFAKARKKLALAGRIMEITIPPLHFSE